ncbi:unnamed protein product [Linum tenue]|uniref:Uncharacterized protein n=1 Tax=Linum tenue TaxID=586396 RepID=A0AAV0Q5X3_9ROSI|nr:unnamed protein product [Linum tenue]
MFLIAGKDPDPSRLLQLGIIASSWQTLTRAIRIREFAAFTNNGGMERRDDARPDPSFLSLSKLRQTGIAIEIGIAGHPFAPCSLAHPPPVRRNAELKVLLPRSGVSNQPADALGINGQSHGNFTSTLPLAFPSFDGENPKEWIIECELLFDESGIPDERRVELAAAKFHRRPAIWFWNWGLRRAVLDWDEFVDAVCNHFGSTCRLSLPSFSGENPKDWVRKCEELFRFHKIPKHERVGRASICLEGRALGWFRYWHPRHDFCSWPTFATAVCEYFWDLNIEWVVGVFNMLIMLESVEEYQE